ncbi:hypothetical protein E1K68_08135 [Pseudomonas sp. B2021]|uniref:hypothetical protein n=1 Tax=Pseudomonas sp. B2021 TaxID=2546445 RepID=UPI001BB07988|nr:hypothetical protein [Pseudomonas sp. B2021]MBR7212745.1 hypothetical protein [Pseudomonas sp. B2021]
MLDTQKNTPKIILRQVVGWVLVLPLLASFARLPFPLGLLLEIGVIAASAYGVSLAWRHASRRVAVLALIITLLNIISAFMLSTASALKALYIISWLYCYPYYADWVYWNF